MPTPSQIVRQINGLIAWLVDQGLADDQCFAHQKTGPHGLVSVTFENAGYAGSARRNRPYDEIYQGFVQDRAFNAKMLDGAIVQMTYGFASGVLQHHRLAFFAAPHLDEFQNNPEIYETDEVYGNVVARNVVPVAVRFDYDGSDAMDHETRSPEESSDTGPIQELSDTSGGARDSTLVHRLHPAEFLLNSRSPGMQAGSQQKRSRSMSQSARPNGMSSMSWCRPREVSPVRSIEGDDGACSRWMREHASAIERPEGRHGEREPCPR